METTEQELIKVFRLKDYRQLKIGLRDKIRHNGEDKIRVIDEGLERLIEGYRSSKILDSREVSEIYGVTRAVIWYWVKCRLISSYKLSRRNGSKHLFIESEINEGLKNNEIELTYSKKINYFARLSKIIDPLIDLAVKEGKISNKDGIAFKFYYLNNNIGIELSDERIRQLAQRTTLKILHMIRYHIQFNKVDNSYKSKYEGLRYKYNELLQQIEKQELYKSTIIGSANEELLGREIKDLQLSERLDHILSSCNIITIGDILTTFNRPDDILKCRNAGTKTFDELIKILKELGIEVIDNKWVFYNMEEIKYTDINNMGSDNL